MLFVKRGKARNKGQQFPNLALQSTGKRYIKVSDAKGVKPQLQSGAIPVVDSSSEDNARREKLIALAQQKMFPKKTYRNVTALDKETSIPVAERYASGYQADTWLINAKRSKTFRSVTPVLSYDLVPTVSVFKIKRMINSIVQAYYNKNATPDKIYRLLMDTVANYDIEIGTRWYYYDFTPLSEISNYTLGKGDDIYFDEMLRVVQGNYDNEWNRYDRRDLIQMALYHAIAQENPLATKWELYHDYRYIGADLQAMQSMIRKAKSVLGRKKSRKLSPKNLKDMIRHLSLPTYLETRDFIHKRLDEKYLNISQGTPTTNDMVEKVDDDELSSKFNVSYNGYISEKEVKDAQVKASEVLPKFVSEELGNKIIEEANKNFEKNIGSRIDYKRDEGGVHGKAKFHKFVPNRRDKVAEEKLHKQLSDAGIKPRNIHRILTDKKVFTRRKKIAGGSVMIDFSGSMGWGRDEVREVIRLLPASTIAGYTGYARGMDFYHGDIRIIADKGKYDDNAIDRLHDYGNNNIDLDALKWLAQQDEPRIWVSDQQVIGVKDGYATNLKSEFLAEISHFIRKHNIIPIEKYEYVKEFATQYANHIG
jgi:hypothetical protein